MARYKQFYVIRTNCTLYQAYAEDKEEALAMVSRRDYLPAGSPTQKGYGSVQCVDTKLEEYKVTDEIRDCAYVGCGCHCHGPN